MEEEFEKRVEGIIYTCTKCNKEVSYKTGFMSCTNTNCKGTNFKKKFSNESYLCF